MRRLAVWFVGASLLGWTALLPVSAQAPGGDALRTITSPQGYEFQVPADWRPLPSGVTAPAFTLSPEEAVITLLPYS